MPITKAQGIVLKQINLGEADKIITLFTDRLGKISAVVHGARKAKSRFMSSTQVFAHCEYMLYKGKSLYTVSQTEIIDSFQVLLGDLYKLTYSSYLLELVDVLVQEEEQNIDMFKLLLKSLRLMTKDDIDLELAVRAFELKSLSISGYMPGLYSCVICDLKDLRGGSFSSSHGGMLCAKCSSKDSYSINIDVSTVNVMRYLLKADMEKIHNLKLSPQIKNEMKKIMKNYIKYYLERDFKSLNFLDNLSSI